MDSVSLSVQARDPQQTATQLRRAGLVPCVLYGNNVKSTPLQGNHKELMKTFVKAGENTVVSLAVDGKAVPVLFHSLDFDSTTDNILHVDFYAVDMKKEIEAKVPLHIVGEPPVVKNLGGMILNVIDHVTVRCLPGNLPHQIEVNVSTLENFGDHVVISQLSVPKGVEILEEPEQQVVNAHAPRAEEVEEKPAEGEAAAEGAEGAAAAEGGAEAKAEAPAKKEKGK